jgi:hypothetical protein
LEDVGTQAVRQLGRSSGHGLGSIRGNGAVKPKLAAARHQRGHRRRNRAGGLTGQETLQPVGAAQGEDRPVLSWTDAEADGEGHLLLGQQVCWYREQLGRADTAAGGGHAVAQPGLHLVHPGEQSADESLLVLERPHQTRYQQKTVIGTELREVGSGEVAFTDHEDLGKIEGLKFLEPCAVEAVEATQRTQVHAREHLAACAQPFKEASQPLEPVGHSRPDPGRAGTSQVQVESRINGRIKGARGLGHTPVRAQHSAAGHDRQRHNKKQPEARADPAREGSSKVHKSALI